MVGSRLNVHLYRDSFNTPWGFRLQGGKDLNQPLTVQRVFSNSPAEGELQRGDVILSINNRDSSQLTHKQAQDLIKHGGGQVQLVVTRPPPGSHVGPLSPPIVLNKPRAPSLQQPPSMPGGTGYGHMPTKVSLTRLGGGGPEFGSDFSKGGGVGYGQTPAQRYEPAHEKSTMLNRVHTSLDNITLSPRTPEVNVSSPFYQPFEPQASSYQPAAPSYQPSGPAYQPTSPAYQPMSPTYQPYQSPPQQMYTPTGLLLEQQRLQEQQQEEGEAIVPVWERRKQFQAGPAAPTAVRTPGNKPPPKIPKPKPGPTQYSNFGTDYGSQQKKPGSSWRPAPVFKPTPAPVAANPVASYTPSPASVQYAPRPAAPAPAAPAPPPQQAPAYSPQQAWQGAEDERTPAWRSSLKSTGVKPWEEDVPYAIPQEPKRSGQFKPTPAPQAAPYSPPQPKVVDGSAGGPKVVHLQYNSPMGLYSNQNVEETLKGQTQAMAGQSKGRPGPPKVAPKPQVSPGLPQQHQQSGYFDEIAASDF